MNKELIKQRFSRKLNLYNENARIQKQMAEKLINMAIPFPVERRFEDILEIGCGTGLLTELADKKLDYKNYIALDIVPECKKHIEKIDSNIKFISNDIESYIEISKTFDLIISNASLQWIESLPQFINKLVSKLNPNGKLLFSTFGKENFREIYFVLGKTLTYFSKSELQEKLKNWSPQIEEEVRVMAFKTPKDVLKHIQNTGVNALSQETWTKKDLVNFEKEYNSFCFNRPTLTYNPIYVSIQK